MLEVNNNNQKNKNKKSSNRKNIRVLKENDTFKFSSYLTQKLLQISLI